MSDEADDWYEIDDDDYLEVNSDQAPTNRTHEKQLQEDDQQPTLNGQVDTENPTQNSIEESELELIAKSGKSITYVPGMAWLKRLLLPRLHSDKFHKDRQSLQYDIIFPLRIPSYLQHYTIKCYLPSK